MPAPDRQAVQEKICMIAAVLIGPKEVMVIILVTAVIVFLFVRKKK